MATLDQKHKNVRKHITTWLSITAKIIMLLCNAARNRPCHRRHRRQQSSQQKDKPHHCTSHSCMLPSPLRPARTLSNRHLTSMTQELLTTQTTTIFGSCDYSPHCSHFHSQESTNWHSHCRNVAISQCLGFSCQGHGRSKRGGALGPSP
jgi:hypothetical protein